MIVHNVTTMSRFIKEGKKQTWTVNSYDILSMIAGKNTQEKITLNTSMGMILFPHQSLIQIWNLVQVKRNNFDT